MIKKRSAGDANGTLRPQAAAAGGASTTPMECPQPEQHTPKGGAAGRAESSGGRVASGAAALQLSPYHQLRL